jgi:putative endonuclease
MRWPLLRREIGQTGEWLAARHLFAKGFRLLEHNYRCDQGEIDLIAEDRGTLVFVEVKTRKSLASGAPEEAVDREKRRRICRAAKWFLEPWKRWPLPIRFDIVGIELDENDRVKEIRHTRGAFEIQED